MTYSVHLFRHLRLTIGQNIQRQRVRERMTLARLAKLSGVPESALDRYELGKDEISLLTLLKIACAMQIGIGDLVARPAGPS